jgi:hypothetical protein
MTKLAVAVSNFANAPTNGRCIRRRTAGSVMRFLCENVMKTEASTSHKICFVCFTVTVLLPDHKVQNKRTVTLPVSGGLGTNWYS